MTHPTIIRVPFAASRCTFLAATCAFAASSLFVYARQDATDCLTGIKRFEQTYSRIEVTAEVRTYDLSVDENDGSVPSDRLIRVSKTRFWRDGDVAHAIARLTHRRMSRGKVSERIEENEDLIRPERILSVPRNPETGRYAGTNLIADFPDGTQNHLLQLITRSELDPFIFAGYVDMLGPKFSEKLSSADAALAFVKLGGLEVVRLNFEDAWGQHQVWLDPARGNHPVRLIQKKLASHLIEPRRRIDSLPENPEFGRLTEKESEVLVTRLQQVGGAWIVGEYESRARYVFSKSKTTELKSVAKILDASRNLLVAQNALKLATDVPSGARVSVPAERHVRYEWQDGEIVKSVDQPAADRLARQEFRQSSHWQAWSILGGIAVVSLAAFMWLRRRPEIR